MAHRPTFGERIRQAREMKSKRDGVPVTQLDLAQRLAKSRNAVDAWENGRTMPPAHTRARIAEALDVSLEWLEGRSQEPARHNGHREVDYIAARPIARAMGVIREAEELRFSSPTSAQKGRVWLEQFLLDLAEKGADEEFLASTRRLLLNPANYEHGFGAAAGAHDEMDDEQKLRHMKALAVGVEAALRERVKKGRGSK